jgi:predicted permease
MTFDRLCRVIRLRVRSLSSAAALDRELDEELRYHLDRQIEANLAAGMTAPDARTAALRALGGIEPRKEQCRDERGVSTIEHVVRDLRLATRQLRKEPGFAATAIVSLALGIGANTAIFQLLDAVTFRPLPVAAPDELAEVRLEGSGRAGRHTGRNRQWSSPQWVALQQRQQAFESMLAFGDTRFNLAPSGEVRYVEGLWVSGSFFETLRVAPAVGRLIGPADDRPGCGFPGAVISHALWQREYGGRADIVGQVVPFESERVPILGVTPPGFYGVEVGRRFDVAMPVCAAGFERRDHWWLAAIGRLKPGWTVAQAQAHLAALLPAIQLEAMPSEFDASGRAAYTAMRVEVVDARGGVSPLRRSYRQPLWILMAIAGLVLLIASVNLANLLLARATARQQEFAVRLAIGGSRGRVLQQVLIESALLALLGSVAAVGVAVATSRSILRLISTSVDPVHLDLAIDWRVFGFTMSIAAAAALIFGIAPAMRAARATALQPGHRGATAPRAALAARRGLVSLQVAITVVLLFGALLFVRSFANLATQNLGVRPDGVVIANVFFPPSSYPPEKRAVAYRDLEHRLRALPGVVAIGEAFTTPVGGSFSNRQIRIDGELKGESYRNRVGPGYFAAVGTPIVAGRDIDARDTPGAPLVALVNEQFAETYLAGDPLARRFATVNDAGVPDTVYEVVGVVKNQKYMRIREPFPPIFYPASAQEPRELTQRYVVRSPEPPALTMAAIGAVLRETDPMISVRFAQLSTQVADALVQERLMARLAAVFAVVALLLAMVGLHGVVAYSVATRRSEIGLRVALGASRPQVMAMVLGDVGRMLGVGVVAGGLIALAASRGLGSLLYDLEAADPTTLAVAIGVLTLAGFVAAASPTRQAAGVDPMQALREG